MNQRHDPPLSSRTQRARRRRVGLRRAGFSLLEILLSAAILAASSMVLFSTFSLGNRQGTQAVGEQHALWLCQSLVEELLARPDKLQPAEGVSFPGAPEWVYSIQSMPTNVDGLVAVTVRVAQGTAVGRPASPAESAQSTVRLPAAIPPAVSSTSQSSRGPSVGTPAVARRGPECTIVRWMRAAPTNPRASSTSDAADGDESVSSFPPGGRQP